MTHMESGEYLSKEDAGKVIRECSRQNRFILTRHFRDELAQEDLTIADVHRIIQRGYVFTEPDRNVATGDWKYRLCGTGPDGQFVTVVFCINSDEEGILITVFSVENSLDGSR